jgi:hypothetical protein
MRRRGGLLHPRDKRSTLQVFRDVDCCGVGAGLGLVALVAAEAFPGPVACAERAQVVVALKRGRPGRSGGVVWGFISISLADLHGERETQWLCCLGNMALPCLCACDPHTEAATLPIYDKWREPRNMVNFE